jgi:arylsulfatase A-like enzyme
LSGWLRRGELTLAEVLREAGYRGAAVVGHVLVDARHGFAQGFEHFDASLVRGEAAITSREVTDAAVAWLDRVGRERFLLFLHYFDPHYEYRDHAEWDFADGYRGWIRDEQPDIYSLRYQAHRLRAEDVAHLRDLYDEEVAFTDREIGRFLEALRARGLDEETAVVLVADHGEEFLEHGWLGHTASLYEEVIRVPLLLRLPGVGTPGRVVDDPVETRSLYATLLDYLDVRGAARGSAPSLLPLLRDEEVRPAPVFSSVWLPDAAPESGKRVRRSSVRSGAWKLIRDHDGAGEQLFHLRDDPRETRNLARAAPRRRAELAAALDAWLGRMREASGPVPVRELSEEERRRLEALGYL